MAVVFRSTEKQKRKARGNNGCHKKLTKQAGNTIDRMLKSSRAYSKGLVHSCFVKIMNVKPSFSYSEPAMVIDDTSGSCLMNYRLPV